MFLNNRYHDPTLGTFISVDPLVAATGDASIDVSGNIAAGPAAWERYYVAREGGICKRVRAVSDSA